MKKRWLSFVCVFLLLAGLAAGCKTRGNTETTQMQTQIQTQPPTEPQHTMSEEELQTRKQFLRGKYVSILGDSISTYEGISNAGTVNTTIEGYNAWYNGDWKDILASPDGTYWGSVISKYGMKLLVNNSCGGNKLVQASGTGVYADAGYKRVENLAANTGELNGIQPDIIFLYMGINDFNGNTVLGNLTEDILDYIILDDGYITPSTFTEAYIITMEKATKLYPDAQIFLFTLIPSHYNTAWEYLEDYNARIREIAALYEGAVLVDIAADSGITPENYQRYTYDGTHPNGLGFAAISAVLEQAVLNNP